MADQRPAARRIRAFINSLSLRPLRTCYSLHHCALCNLPITLGQQYRDGGGVGRRAHEDCFKAVAQEFRHA